MTGIRYDRAASLYLFQPLNRCLRRAGAGIPILMYHRVPHADDCTTHPYYCTNTTTQAFSAQMRFLHERGYRTVSVTEAYRQAQTGLPARKLMAITFDDGYQDFYTNAFPILNRYGYSATMFLPTAYIGDAPRRFKDVECLTWSQVRELRRAGVEFGSHTVTHPQLRDVSEERLRAEVAGSRQDIEQHLGEAVKTFCYPYAFPEADRGFVATLQHILRESGYDVGVSTIVGRVKPSANRYFLKRLPVNSHDDLRFFQSKLAGAYDWVHKVQYAAKYTRRRRRHRAILQPI
jgi:peptidoglycan/xylan/chitin deacetylase (PgdA/CDA1 family)